jgi:DeoR/GlpR family transcriptional regulator of sugar metabolism
MTGQERHEEIVKLVQRRGYMSIDALAAHFHVTPQTIRRDINQLSASNQLTRHHGGASLPSSAINTEYAARKIELLDEKEAIARAIAAFLPDRSSVFMTLGTTVETVARALVSRTGLKVVTNNPVVGAVLGPRPDFEVMITGGAVRKTNGGLTGEAALEFVGRFLCDYTIMSVGAVAPDGTLLDFDVGETAVARAMIANSRYLLLAVDHTKFARFAAVRAGHLKNVTTLFTDQPPPPGIAALAQAHEVEVVVAGGY